MEGVELEFREEALRAVARKAMQRKTGARGLRTILENVLLDTMYELPSMANVDEGRRRRGRDRGRDEAVRRLSIGRTSQRRVGDEPSLSVDGLPTWRARNHKSIGARCSDADAGRHCKRSAAPPRCAPWARSSLDAGFLRTRIMQTDIHRASPPLEAIAGAAAARRRRLPAHGDPAVRRPREIDSGARCGHGGRQADHARRAEAGRTSTTRSPRTCTASARSRRSCSC